MNTPIQHTHDGTVITYDEANNKWTFTLRGRDRSAESLAKAKEFIDKPVPAEKAKPFEKIPAWLFPYSDEPEQIEVTGIAEARYHRDQCVWIKSKSGRSKENAALKIYPQNEKNDALIARVIEKQKVIKQLQKEISEIRQKLSPLVLPKDE